LAQAPAHASAQMQARPYVWAYQRPCQRILGLPSWLLSQPVKPTLRWLPKLRAGVIVCLASFSCIPALAVLGERAVGVQAPAASSQLGAVHRAQAITPAAQQAFVVAEAEFETGTFVREYALPNGVVFAVAWMGPVLPDLRQALGSHFAAFATETARARVQGQRGGPVSVEKGDLVVRSTGRMGAFSGHAYLKPLVPVGVDIHELLK
jgi:Protein of unknown function (DUF2844)